MTNIGSVGKIMTTLMGIGEITDINHQLTGTGSPLNGVEPF